MRKLIPLLLLSASSVAFAAPNGTSGSPRVQGVPDGYGDPVQVTIVAADGSDPSGSSVTGNVANAVADSGNPVKIGCKYNSVGYTVLADGQRGDAQCNTLGYIRVELGNDTNQHPVISSVATTGAAQAAGLTVNAQTQVFDPAVGFSLARTVINSTNTTGAGITAAGLMAQFDDVAPTAITENSFGNVRMSTNHNLYGTLRDAAGNERGANVNASNALLADIATVASGAVSTVATGVQKVGIADSAGAALPSIANSLDTTGSGYIGTGQLGQLDDTSPSAVTENRFAVARIGAQRQALNAPLGSYPYSAILGTAAVPIRGASGNVANANAVATLTGTATTTVYMTGFTCTAGGATAAAEVDVAVTGTLGGTMTYTQGAPLGAGVPPSILSQTFNPPYPASAVNTPVVVTMPALGAGNAHAACVATGFYL